MTITISKRIHYLHSLHWKWRFIFILVPLIAPTASAMQATCMGLQGTCWEVVKTHDSVWTCKWHNWFHENVDNWCPFNVAENALLHKVSGEMTSISNLLIKIIHVWPHLIKYATSNNLKTFFLSWSICTFLFQQSITSPWW